MSKKLGNGSSHVQILSVVIGVASLCFGLYWIFFPKFEDYQVQKKVAAVFVSANNCRAEVSQAVQKSSTSELSRSLFVCDGGTSVGATISPHLKSIAVGDAGAITVTLNYLTLLELTPATNVLTLVPTTDGQARLRVGDAGKQIAAWRCGSVMDGTTVPSRYLPSDCRG